MSSSKNLISTEIYGDGNSVLLFSPAYPFKNSIFSNLKKEDLTLIFTTINFHFLNNKNNFNLENFENDFSNIIDSIDENKSVNLVGFGFFSLFFLKLYTAHKDRIDKIFFIEPDFSNYLLENYFDAGIKDFKNFKSLVSFFINRDKIKNNHLNKKNPSIFKNYHNDIKDYLQNNKVLQILIDNKNDINILWYNMDKVSWPLPQILLEEYDLSISSADCNVVNYLLKNSFFK